MRLRVQRLPTQAGDDCVVPDQQVVWMEFFENRNHENALKILEGYGGKVHSDCYQAYEKRKSLPGVGPNLKFTYDIICNRPLLSTFL